MSIYTRTGDEGNTSIYGGKKVRKDDYVIEMNGVLDEASAYLGYCGSMIHEKKINDQIILMQHALYAISAQIAGNHTHIIDIAKETKDIEKHIDEIEKKVPELHNFILPGGSKESAIVHITRTIIRKSERKMVGKTSWKVYVPYINRISDYLFVLARYMNKKKKVKETVWKNRTK